MIMEKVEEVYNIRPLIRSCSKLGFFFNERTRHSYAQPRRESVIYSPLCNQRTISAVEKLDHICIPLKYVTVQILMYLFLQHAIRFPQYINVEKSRSRSCGILIDKGIVLRCLTQTTLRLYRGAQFYCWRKQQCPENTINLPQVTDKLYHIMCYRLHLTICRI